MVEYKSSAGSPMKDTRSYLEPWQINKIIASCPTPRDRLLLLTLARTGRRVSEIVRCLKPKDIDFTNGLIDFTILKRFNRKTKERIPERSLLPVDEEVLAGLKEYIEARRIEADEYIFPISRQRADQIFKRASRKAGIFTIGSGKYNQPHVHVLRHSFAIQGAKSLKSPADLVQLKDMLGHSRIDTTMFYLKFNPAEKRDLLKEMWK